MAISFCHCYCRVPHKLANGIQVYAIVDKKEDILTRDQNNEKPFGGRV